MSARPKRSPINADLMVSLSAPGWSPVRKLALRLLLALSLVATIVGVVYLDRAAYTDSHDGSVSLIDAFYYATVTITTTGYGDITPVADHARVLNAVVITPLRIMFLVLLVGTTLEVLASHGRRMIQDSRWRRQLHDHTVVIGYGTAGRSAVRTLIRSDQNPARIVVIDPRSSAVTDANNHGYAALEGDGTHRDILRQAEISRARQVIITVHRDDTTILAVLTARQLNPSAHLTVAAREDANAALWLDANGRSERGHHLLRGGGPAARALRRQSASRCRSARAVLRPRGPRPARTAHHRRGSRVHGGRDRRTGRCRRAGQHPETVLRPSRRHLTEGRPRRGGTRRRRQLS